MRIKRGLAVFLLGTMFSVQAWAQEIPLKVEISLDSNLAGLFDGKPLAIKIKNGKVFVSPGAYFSVSTRLRNITPHKMTFEVLPCAYGGFHWVSDNEFIGIAPESCVKNVPSRVTLAPGESFEKTVNLVVRSEMAFGITHFRLGFRHLEAGEGEQPIWGNQIFLEVISGKERIGIDN